MAQSVAMPEWLRGQTWNLMQSLLAGSNPAGDELFFNIQIENFFYFYDIKNVTWISKAQTGFEPATFCLQDRCSTTKLLSRMKVSKKSKIQFQKGEF